MASQAELAKTPTDQAYFPAWFRGWLASWFGRWLVLALAACFSLPASFVTLPDIGLDPSWQLSLQLAAADGKVFGREFVFTYGPLGWLLLHIAVSKVGLLLYDFFVLGSLLSIYNALLPERPRPLDAIVVIALAMVTKLCLLVGPSAVLFTIVCFWLWRVYDKGAGLALMCSFVSAVVLFFSKVNYGLVMIFLIPAYGVGLIILRKDRRILGLLLLVGFPLLVLLGAAIWHVDLQGYLRSGLELIAGYNDAMFTYTLMNSVGFELAVLSLLAMACVALCGRHHLVWTTQVMILPLVGLASLLLFKNGFLRSDEPHNSSFHAGLPLLLALWCIAWRSQKGVRVLLLAIILYPITLLIGKTEHFGRNELVASSPLRYLRQVSVTPWHQDSAHLKSIMQARFPEAVLPDDVLAIIGRSSVDVMPWESSIVVLNGLTLKQRPVPQSYSVYTPWLDKLNARFLSSHEAPDFMLYACAQDATIDGRPSAWDESITKRALLENYVFTSQFTVPLRVWPPWQKLEPAPVFVLKHMPGARQLVPILTNEVSLIMGQPFHIPVTTNLLFLTVKVDQTILGRLRGFVLSPSLLMATFEYRDGSSNSYRAILPILKTGVLVNRRMESPVEIRNWLSIEADKNTAISSIFFKSSSGWAFKPEFKGTLVEYRIAQNVIK